MNKSSSLLWQSNRKRGVNIETRTGVRQALNDLKRQPWIVEEVKRGRHIYRRVRR